ncbi:hypothetical protein L195_g011358 [Trifolium pratense]|uniref:CCHC-type domain-containing protein n=1 Tax=Trifolium pratense TaxID=57577 RepID=A0A2K3PHD9_TRIPR|nr:hypothetical protein L195_g011358 [Trifolium pratense]
MDHPNLEGLSLHEGEEGFRFDFEEEEDEQVDLRWCLVGRFISDKAIHFNSMKVRMADLWRPMGGVTIKETIAGKFLFHFAHPLAMEEVFKGGPWSFDNNMLILEQVQLGMQVEHIPLFHVNMWVQVHDLPMGLMKEKVGIPLANYIGSFVEYDKNNNSSFWRQFMRIRVKLDVRLPLKKDTKVMNKEGKWCTVKFKYEKLGIFCFVCGVMGHAENRCEVRFSLEQDDGSREWSSELRAEPRRQGGRMSSRWLREERGGRSENDGGNVAGQSSAPTGSANVDPNATEFSSSNQHPSQNRPSLTQPIITTRQAHSLPINEMQAHSSNLTLKNKNSSPNQIITDPTLNNAAIKIQNTTAQPFIFADNLSNLFPNINSPIMTNHHSSPIIINRPVTGNNNIQSLPHQLLTFNSQPLIKDPPIAQHAFPKTSRASTSKKAPTRPVQTTIAEPNQHRPSPEKKPKYLTDPTQKQPEPTMTQTTTVDNEAQSEKKRRRGEDQADNQVTLKEAEHFLTAGPGSQACRDQ